jgi:hypothetical protein
MSHECHESEYSKFLKSLGIDKEKMLADMESRLPEDKRKRLRKMRLEQYFQTRRKDDLANAKYLEAEVDKALAERYARIEDESVRHTNSGTGMR